MALRIKKIAVGVDALAVATLLFAIAVGVIVFQQTQVQMYYQKYIDSAWEMGDVKGKLLVSDKALASLRESCVPAEVASQ